MTSLSIRHFAAIIGDGQSTSFDIAHNLDTRDVIVQVIDVHTFQLVFTPTVTTLDRNTVRLDFSQVLTYTPPKRWLRYQRRKGKLGIAPGYIPEIKSLRVLISG